MSDVTSRLQILRLSTICLLLGLATSSCTGEPGARDPQADSSPVEGDGCTGVLIVFFDPGAEIDDVEAFAADVRDLPDVDAAGVWDHEQTYEEFVDLFPEHESGPEDMPPSVRVVIQAASADSQIRDLAGEQSQFREVVSTPSSC